MRRYAFNKTRVLRKNVEDCEAPDDFDGGCSEYMGIQRERCRREMERNYSELMNLCFIRQVVYRRYKKPSVISKELFHSNNTVNSLVNKA